MTSIYNFFSSIKLTIWLTYVLVINTAIGSLFLVFSPTLYGGMDEMLLIDWLWKSNFNTAWWIYLLILLSGLFAVNTFFCTYDRMIALIRARRGKKIKLNEEEETLVTEDIKTGIHFRTFLPYIAHIGFLVAMLGHLTGSLWGFKGDEFLLKENSLAPISSSESLTLKAGPMNMIISKRGYPEVMWADITLLSEKKEIKIKRVEINRPLLYEDYAVYIQNIRPQLEGMLVKIKTDEFESQILISPGKILPLGKLKLSVGKVNSRYGAMEIKIWENNSYLGSQWLSPQSENYQKMILPGMEIEAIDFKTTSAVVLKINKDPGAKIVFAGLILFSISIVLHLYFRSRR